MEENQNIKNDGWHRAHTLILLTELQKYKCLYNRLDENFVNQPVRSEKLNLIRDKLNSVKPNVTVGEIKRKIKSLKAQLWKEKQKMINKKISGSVAVARYKSKLWCYKELSFLLSNDAEPSQSNIEMELKIDTEESNDNLEDSGSGITPEKLRIDTEESNDNLEGTGSGTTPEQKRENQTKQEVGMDGDIELQYFEFRPVKQPLEKEDTEKFCQYLCSRLKKIKLEETFENINLQIIALVNQKISEERKQLQASNYLPPIHNPPSFIDPSMQSSTPPFITIPTSFRNTFSPTHHQRYELVHLPPSKLNDPPLEFHHQSYTACSSTSSPDIPPTHIHFQSSSSTLSPNKRNSTRQTICNHKLCLVNNVTDA